MSTTVNLSPETLALLKTAMQINNSIRIEAGNRIRTVSASGSILLNAEVAETFPESFSIYELNRLLNVLSLPLMKGANLIFNNLNYVEIVAGNASVKYKYTNQSFTQAPNREISLPSEDLTFKLSGADLQSLEKMASILGHKYLEIKTVNGKVLLATTSPELSDSSNDSLIDVGDANGAADGQSHRIKFENLILPDGDYEIAVCAAGISKFKHATSKIEVFIGLERV